MESLTYFRLGVFEPFFGFAPDFFSAFDFDFAAPDDSEVEFESSEKIRSHPATNFLLAPV